MENKKDKGKKEKNSEELLKEYEDMLREEASDSCKECGGNLKFDRVNLEDFEGGKLFVIESVPALICEECGETWIPKPFMDEFERMIDMVKQKKIEDLKKKGKKTG